MEEFFETNSQYRSGFVIQEYRGKWSLVSARRIARFAWEREKSKC